MRSPPELNARGLLHLRFEDLDQHGRPMLEPLAGSLGVLWRVLPEASQTWTSDGGVLPLFTRLEIDAGGGPFAVDTPLTVDGTFALRHTRDDQGEVARVILDFEATVSGPLGRTHLPPPDDAGRVVQAATLRSEHIFTRPFALPEERKVRSLVDRQGQRFVPPAQRAWRTPRSTLEVEGDATLLGDFEVDLAPLVLGFRHSDSNQHINSLVYPAFFEDAVLRRLGALRRDTSVLGRRLDVAYRRPSFVGEQLEVLVRLHTRGDDVVATGVFVTPGERDLSRGRVFVQLVLR
jgi:hypothetical protein